MNKKVIYSALTRGYDELRQPQVVHSDYDYICFSNDIPEKQIGVWQIRSIPQPQKTPVRSCRWVKMHPHILLPEYECSLWLDCNNILTEEHYKRTEQLIIQKSICAMVLHPERDCVYQEAYALTGSLIDDPDTIYRQTQFLLQERFPPRAGLFVTCCVYRKHQDPDIIRFSELWWDLLDRFSTRDQMGVNFALAKTGITPDIFRGRDYWELFRISHRKPLLNNNLKQKCFRFLASHWYVRRLKFLFCRHGIKHYDWRKLDTLFPESP